MAEGEERPIVGGEDDENGKYPIGFRFKPTTEELVEFYLLPKLLGEPTVPNEFVIDAPAYECEPDILTEKYKESGVDDGTWYFLSPRYRRYEGGGRPARRTDDDRGRWKPSTGQSSKPPEVEAEDASTSRRRRAAFSENTLAYYVGPTKGETKTKWLMQELVVPETPGNGFHFHGNITAAAATDDDETPDDNHDMLLNRYVVCRIYKSPLRKWKKEIEEEAAAAEVPTSSQSSRPAPDCVGEAAARASSSRQQRPAKRPAVERPATSGHTGGPNKGASVSQTTLFAGGGRSAAPTRGNGGGSSVRMPAVGVGAGAAGRHGPAGMPAPMHWPPVYNSMQGPVQVQQRPLEYGYRNRAAGMANANGQAAPGQGPPVLKLRPTATATNSQVPTMMRPPHVAAGQQEARLPSPRQQQQPQPETEEACRNRVYARLIAEMKLQKAQQDSAARAGQQQISQTASAPPAPFRGEGGDRHVGAEAMVSPAQFPAPHSSSSSLAQRTQRQQSSAAAPAPPAAVEKAPAAEKVPSKQPVPSGANEGSCKGDAATATIADNIVLQILKADHWTL